MSECTNIKPNMCGNRGLDFPSDSCSTVRIEGTADTTINQGLGIDLTDGVHAYDGDGNEIPFEVEPETIPKCDVGEHLVKYTATGKGDSMRPSLCGSNALAVSDACSDLTTVEKDRIVTITQADPPTINGIDEVQITTSTMFDPTDGVSAVDDNGNIIPFEYSGEYDLMASGDIASFETEYAQNAKSVLVELEPIQDLHGYDKPWSGGNGKNLIEVSEATLAQPSWYSGTWAGTSVASGENAITVTRHNGEGGFGGVVIPNGLKAGTYTISMDAPTTTGAKVLYYGWSENGAFIRQIIAGGYGADETHITRTFTLENDADGFYVKISGQPSDMPLTFTHIQVEEGSTATSYEPYANICPITGRTEVETIVSPTTDAYDGNTYTTDLGRTVYGGTLDVVSGELTIDWVKTTVGALGQWYYAEDGNFFYREPIPRKGERKYYCDSYPYVDNIGATTEDNVCGAHYSFSIAIRDNEFSTPEEFAEARKDVEFVYKTSQDYNVQLTPQQVQLLLGENNVWSDDGDVEVIYEANIPQSDSFPYPVAGTYEITYTAEDECGNTVEITRIIEVR